VGFCSGHGYDTGDFYILTQVRDDGGWEIIAKTAITKEEFIDLTGHKFDAGAKLLKNLIDLVEAMAEKLGRSHYGLMSFPEERLEEAMSRIRAYKKNNH
jgi:hypothetical protein